MTDQIINSFMFMFEWTFIIGAGFTGLIMAFVCMGIIYNMVDGIFKIVKKVLGK